MIGAGCLALTVLLLTRLYRSGRRRGRRPARVLEATTPENGLGAELEQFFLHVGRSTYCAWVIEIGSRARWRGRAVTQAMQRHMAPRSNADDQKPDTWVTHFGDPFACNATAAQTQYLL